MARDTDSRVWQWRSFVWPLWAERITIFIALTRMAWRTSRDAAVVQRVMLGQLTPDVVSLSITTSSGNPAVENPKYTLFPWAASMELTRDVADTTRFTHGYRTYLQLPTGRVYVVAAGDIRYLKRINDGA